MSGIVNGIPNRFCVFQSGSSVALIDPTTLQSHNYSIAATYLKSGLNLGALNEILGGGASGDEVCDALKASTIFMEIGGSYPGPRGPKAVCIFGDGSKIGVDELIKVSKSPSYLGLRDAVSAQPVNADLPYLKSQTVNHSNQVTIQDMSAYQGPNWQFIWQGQYSITPNQPWGGVNSSSFGSGAIIIYITAGRQDSDASNNFISSQATSQFISTEASSSMTAPTSSNFAVEGNLVIGGVAYPIMLVQRGSGGRNYWWLAGASPGWSYVVPALPNSPFLVTPDNRYQIWAWTLNTFNVGLN
jgi:hypothetical protein